MTDLSTLIARVEAGSGADRDLSFAVYKALGERVAKRAGVFAFQVFEGGLWRTMPDLTTDLNAVIALVEARLPGWVYQITTYLGDGASATLDEWNVYDTEQSEAYAPTPARALLAALLRAEMEKQT
jgi:hypothetical protein